MSPINFDTFAKNNPALATTFHNLGGWLRAHPHVTTINSIAVADSLKDEDPKKLARAFFMLVDRGLLTQHYQLQTPEGTLVGELYGDVMGDLPPTVEGRFHERISTDDCLLVPVYQVSGAAQGGQRDGG